MSDNSSFRERLKRAIGRDKKDFLFAKSKAQDGSPKYSAVSSTNSRQGSAMDEQSLLDAVLCPSEHAGPSTITVPPALPPTPKSFTLHPAGLPAPLDTTSNTSLNNTAVKAAAVIPQTATADQAADITKDSARDCSLWDTAYDALKKVEPGRIAGYEDLLSRVPTRGNVGLC